MAVTHAYQYEPSLNLRTIYPCSEETITFRSAPRLLRTVADNPKESRIYPGEPEWMYPTSQAKQYTDVKHYGLTVQGPYISGYTACGGVSMPIFQEKGYSIDPKSKVGVAPSTNWATDMRLRIKDEAVNLGASLAEYRETATMFRRFALGARDAWKLFRGRLPNRSRLTPCDVAAAELTMSYGVLPLAKDFYDSFEALQGRLVDPVYRRFVVTSKDRRDFDVDYKKGFWETSERAIAYVELEPDRSDFTLGNPLEVAWEIVPFSFVVDWAIPVGDYLSALDALKDVKSMRGTLTRKEKYRHDYYYLAPGHRWVRPSFALYHSHQRTVVTTVPLPRLPTWQPSKSWKAIMHGVSLLTSLNQRCKR